MEGHYNSQHIETLEDRPHRPKRQPTYSADLVNAVLRLREKYPRWGKDKLVILLYREGFACSASTAGRILHKLKERGVLKEPLAKPHICQEEPEARPLCGKKS